MEIQITSTNIRYADGDISAVHVQFQGRDTERTINLNGYIPLTREEYVSNLALPELTQVIREKLIERLEIPNENQAD
ncbi:hypothetical protein [Alkalihalobacillus sp. LMS39]|uniref:hypothetical protein n=1 Tax=Alkalihalobacillus sp. LMS39 TaxID=2924032 RepID=UPI001FB52D0F|nr:hypothetical protein [Alkalihalobacillus sp. LMS39]UOE96082.1 hypothetical protein MM271_10980 [Alkalihalobacillus sp. LMS39]